MSKQQLVTSPWRDARRRDASAVLVSTAWDIVREDGLGGLSLRDLARRAGITTPTVYAYFESKNAIYDAMFGQAWSDYEQVALADDFIEFLTIPAYEQLD